MNDDMFHDSADLEAIADFIHTFHVLRLDRPKDRPMVPRPYRARPRPRTAIISEAAARHEAAN